MTGHDDPELNDIEDAVQVPPTGAHMLTVDAVHAGLRLDRFLASRLDGLSRARIQALIRQGKVECATGLLRDPGNKVAPGQTIRITIPPLEPAGPVAEAVPLSI